MKYRIVIVDKYGESSTTTEILEESDELKLLERLIAYIYMMKSNNCSLIKIHQDDS